NSNGGTSAQTSPAPAASFNVSVWWPTEGSLVKGVQPFKALVDNVFLDNYSMYWQVDNGQLNPMTNSFDGGGHKEALVDLTNWNWKGSGPYAITVVAKNPSGTIMATKTVNIMIDSGTTSKVASTPVTTTPSTSSQPASAPVDTTSQTVTTPPAPVTNLNLSIGPVST